MSHNYTVCAEALAASLIALLAATLTSGCEDEFPEYADVQGLRLLGLRATPSDLAPEAEATLDALVSVDASYQWSWCPLPFGGAASDVCPLTEAELDALLVESGTGAEAPPYDLGTEPTASFVHSIPPLLLEGICAALAEQELPEGVPRPECSGRFVVSVRLVVTTESAEVAGTRELGLIYQQAVVPNAVPEIASGEISVRGAPPFVLAEDVATTVSRDVEYRLEIGVAEDSAETFMSEEDGELVSKRESLTMTWFYEGGSMDKERSSFIDGFTDLENLGENFFQTPTVDLFERDQSRLFFVLRDDRGGIDWFVAPLELVE